ncbi:3-deoxy-D-manno-octulosonic acid transferase [Sphingobacterium hungaricum]|uniref:3-deoxy-D-manno-octulosonic acid transferase n=1 Tax=Sphingobacterium hungaricum TaxID=2082723 RepID=A0A928UZS8_9SPHI|nr:glycosyltransferase N-terminal domain-containing protein [Sphingobacterium hungaricum]MBE8714069.1 3-deoxy-D-manno-octulosonic acid transferase [Sphingobacterium hungaricum]
MRLIYDLGILLYGIILRMISPFHRKAKLWVTGRKNVFDQIEQTIPKGDKPIWFHFASLGEFEQGRSVIELIKEKYPQEKILLTFFSPSGYEIRKNFALADYVFYLPEDTQKNAQKFIEFIEPRFVVFTKYEYWYHYFNQLKKSGIPLLMISAIFRNDQVFFKSYGGFFRKILKNVTYFFIQNNHSTYLLKSIDILNAGLAGDTRFDRVAALSKKQPNLIVVQKFIGKQQVLVGGSTWPKDEEFIKSISERYSLWKFILAPHEIDVEHIESITRLFPKSIQYSKIMDYSDEEIRAAQVLIIDSIGLLSSLYYYADLTYIGGGFGAGIHNTLEAATYGKPILFGPKYEKFQEAIDLVELGAGFPFTKEKELMEIVQALQDQEKRKIAGDSAADYVQQRRGATQIIMKYIETENLI